MRRRLLFAWLASAIGLFCLHYGPGKDWLKSDQSARLTKAARLLEEKGDWAGARERYEEALASLPTEGYDEEVARLKLSKAWTYLNTRDVAEATSQIEALVDQQHERTLFSGPLMHDLRAALAHAEYYTAWHMRLEQAPRKEWMRELDVSRRNFRYLAETVGSPELKLNLEAAVLLSRLGFDELEGIPLPEENAGKGSKQVSDKRGEAQDSGDGDEPGEGEGDKNQEGDGEPSDARGQGLGKRPDGIGS